MKKLLPLLCLLALARPVEGQPPVPKSDGLKVVITQADEAKFPEINVYFELRKPDGTPIRDATRGEFRVVEDGQERPILAFDAPLTVEKRATTVVLVVDRSGSMNDEGKMEGMREAVRTFLQDLPPGSRVSVIAFGSQVSTACPFTEDMDRVRAAIDRLEPVGATRFYDAVAEAVRRLEREPGRKAILALTDGQDTDSQRSDLPGVIDLARRANLPIHTLGLGRDEQIDADALEELARESRGQFYRAESADALRKIYEELAERLGASYRVAYSTDRPIRDGTLRPIQIFHEKGEEAGETAVFIPGMVAPVKGWSRLYVLLLGGLAALAILPGRLKGRAA